MFTIYEEQQYQIMDEEFDVPAFIALDNPDNTNINIEFATYLPLVNLMDNWYVNFEVNILSYNKSTQLRTNMFSTFFEESMSYEDFLTQYDNQYEEEFQYEANHKEYKYIKNYLVKNQDTIKNFLILVWGI